MRRNVSIDVWSMAFMATLGLFPTALAGCGDTAYQNDSEPEAGEPGPGEPEAGEPSTGEPSVVEPGTGEPEVEIKSPFPCVDAQPLLSSGQDTGFDRCEGNFIRRRAQVECPSLLPREHTCMSGFPEGDSCSSDGDCTDSAYGTCNSGFDGGCYCSYGCVADSDCNEGQICLCGESIGRCTAANCVTDDDCPGDLLCTAYTSDPGCGGPVFACQTPQDNCGGDADCEAGELCSSVDGITHTCEQISCAIGRPFLVEGVERLAPIQARADWQSTACHPDVQDLPQELRDHLQERWTLIGLMEHASVAAFARFTLQLMSLGAPPELLVATQKAMADETEHARLAFAIASRLSGRDIGPGNLEIEGSLEHNTPRDIVAMLIREGCIGETVAALEAAEALQHTVDPDIRQVLERITEDEQDHGRLAWQTLRWMLSTGDANTKSMIREEFEIALQEEEDPGTGETHLSGAQLLAWGIVPESMRAEIRRDVLHRVVRPCLKALLGETAQTPIARA